MKMLNSRLTGSNTITATIATKVTHYHYFLKYTLFRGFFFHKGLPYNKIYRDYISDHI